MSDDEYDDEPNIEEEFDDDTLDDDDALDDADLDEALVVDEVLVGDLAAVVDASDDDDDDDTGAETAKEDDDEVIDLDEELHPDDVEEALDVVLRERTAKAGLEDEEEDDEPEDRAEAGNKIVPRRPGEFVCSSCFLVLPGHMIADEANRLCQDCL